MSEEQAREEAREWMKSGEGAQAQAEKKVELGMRSYGEFVVRANDQSALGEGTALRTWDSAIKPEQIEQVYRDQVSSSLEAIATDKVRIAKLEEFKAEVAQAELLEQKSVEYRTELAKEELLKEKTAELGEEKAKDYMKTDEAKEEVAERARSDGIKEQAQAKAEEWVASDEGKAKLGEAASADVLKQATERTESYLDSKEGVQAIEAQKADEANKKKAEEQATDYMYLGGVTGVLTESAVVEIAQRWNVMTGSANEQADMILRAETDALAEKMAHHKAETAIAENAFNALEARNTAMLSSFMDSDKQGQYMMWNAQTYGKAADELYGSWGRDDVNALKATHEKLDKAEETMQAVKGKKDGEVTIGGETYTIANGTATDERGAQISFADLEQHAKKELSEATSEWETACGKGGLVGSAMGAQERIDDAQRSFEEKTKAWEEAVAKEEAAANSEGPERQQKVEEAKAEAEKAWNERAQAQAELNTAKASYENSSNELGKVFDRYGLQTNIIDQAQVVAGVAGGAEGTDAVIAQYNSISSFSQMSEKMVESYTSFGEGRMGVMLYGAINETTPGAVGAVLTSTWGATAVNDMYSGQESVFFKGAMERDLDPRKKGDFEFHSGAEAYYAVKLNEEITNLRKIAFDSLDPSKSYGPDARDTLESITQGAQNNATQRIAEVGAGAGVGVEEAKAEVQQKIDAYYDLQEQADAQKQVSESLETIAGMKKELERTQDQDEREKIQLQITTMEAGVVETMVEAGAAKDSAEARTLLGNGSEAVNSAMNAETQKARETFNTCNDDFIANVTGTVPREMITAEKAGEPRINEPDDIMQLTQTAKKYEVDGEDAFRKASQELYLTGIGATTEEAQAAVAKGDAGVDELIKEKYISSFIERGVDRAEATKAVEDGDQAISELDRSLVEKELRTKFETALAFELHARAEGTFGPQMRFNGYMEAAGFTNEEARDMAGWVQKGTLEGGTKLDQLEQLDQRFDAKIAELEKKAGEGDVVAQQQLIMAKAMHEEVNSQLGAERSLARSSYESMDDYVRGFENNANGLIHYNLNNEDEYRHERAALGLDNKHPGETKFGIDIDEFMKSDAYVQQAKELRREIDVDMYVSKEMHDVKKIMDGMQEKLEDYQESVDDYLKARKEREASIKEGKPDIEIPKGVVEYAGAVPDWEATAPGVAKGPGIAVAEAEANMFIARREHEAYAKENMPRAEQTWYGALGDSTANTEAVAQTSQDTHGIFIERNISGWDKVDEITGRVVTGVLSAGLTEEWGRRIWSDVVTLGIAEGYRKDPEMTERVLMGIATGGTSEAQRAWWEAAGLAATSHENYLARKEGKSNWFRDTFGE